MTGGRARSPAAVTVDVDSAAGDAGVWSRLAAEAAGCQACPLWEHGTRTVFGAGPVPAALMLVGEQPGDKEDLDGRPFVGPAGRILDDALEQAGIDRSGLYLTNAVKHFKWTPRGKRRLHQRPNGAEMRACHPWLDSEIAVVDPRIVVALGAVAAESLLGPSVRVTKSRGQAFESAGGRRVVLTVHPSSILRGERAEREAAITGLAADLRVAQGLTDQRSR